MMSLVAQLSPSSMALVIISGILLMALIVYFAAKLSNNLQYLDLYGFNRMRKWEKNLKKSYMKNSPQKNES